MEDLKDLKKEAKDLGISHSPNISAAKLKEKIEAKYEAEENKDEVAISDINLEGTALFKAQDNKAAKVKRTIRERARIAEKAARTTVVVEITDNDPTMNTMTTTCEPSCGNLYFDLGTVVLPLNIPVSVMQGHIDTLKEIMILQHLVDHKTGLNKSVMRRRYTISYVR
jgi:hypothetical protein